MKLVNGQHISHRKCLTRPQIHLLGMNIGDQGLIQKEKVHIHCEKGAQLNILASKIATQ